MLRKQLEQGFLAERGSFTGDASFGSISTSWTDHRSDLVPVATGGQAHFCLQVEIETPLNFTALANSQKSGVSGVISRDRSKGRRTGHRWGTGRAEELAKEGWDDRVLATCALTCELCDSRGSFVCLKGTTAFSVFHCKATGDHSAECGVDTAPGVHVLCIGLTGAIAEVC